MKQLICLSHTHWSASPTRTQQLLARLKDVKILYFELTEGHEQCEPGQRVRPNITVYPLPLSASKHLSSRLLRGSALSRCSRYVSKIMQKHRFKEPTFWLDSPHLYPIPSHIPHHGLIYDCDREWDELPLDWESELALRADVVFTVSEGLSQRLAPCCDNIAVIPNGVNFPMFSRSSDDVPPTLAGLRGPILARVGEVTEDLELEPLLHAASARPEWTFLLIGSVSDGVQQILSRYRNIVLTGRVPMVETPDYLGCCSVQFDLLSRSDAGSDILSPHLFEYLAVGKPIVLMIVPEQIEPFPDVAYTASNPAAFLRVCEKALAEDPNWLRPRRQSYAYEAQWSQRAAEIQQILETAALL